MLLFVTALLIISKGFLAGIFEKGIIYLASFGIKGSLFKLHVEGVIFTTVNLSSLGKILSNFTINGFL